jgi:hypothetical protein
VAQAVVRHLAPFTRTGLVRLRPEGPETPVHADLHLSLNQAVNLALAFTEGPGRLPDRVQAVPDPVVMGAALEAERQRVLAGLPGVLASWAHVHPRGFRQRLLPDECFLHPPRAFGVETACTRCGGLGPPECAACAGTGLTHRSGEVQAEVSAEEATQIDCPDPDLARLLRKRLAPEQWLSWGELVSVRHQTLPPNHLLTLHHVRLPAWRAPLRVLKQPYVFHGLGPQAEVIDFGDVSRHLVAQSLLHLEAAVQGPTWQVWRAWRVGTLPLALKRFAGAEVNLAMVLALGEHGHKPGIVAATLDRRFQGAVDTTHVARAMAAWQAAIDRLYGGHLAAPTLLLALLTATASTALLLRQNPPDAMGILLALAAMGLGWGLWWGVEALQRARLRRLLPGKLGTGTTALLRDSGTLQRWRIGSAAATLASCLLAGAVAAHVIRANAPPPLDAENLMQLDVVLRAWADDPSPDVRLRPTPGLSLLRQGVTMGKPLAAIVLAWVVLQDTPDHRPDPLAALDALRVPGVQQEPLGQLAQAVAYLQLPALPLTQRAQAWHTLDALATQGLTEALYWQGRLALAAHPPEGAPGRPAGLQALILAAGQGHGDAALLLGTLFAQGQGGLTRDRLQARRYLQQAIDAHVPEAPSALAKLPLH